jgi:hypothetical protein
MQLVLQMRCASHFAEMDWGGGQHSLQQIDDKGPFVSGVCPEMWLAQEGGTVGRVLPTEIAIEDSCQQVGVTDQKMSLP